MTSKRHFKCTQCDAQTELDPKADAPDCCGQPMAVVDAPLDKCTLSSTAEHSRLDDTVEPCDDGRAG